MDALSAVDPPSSPSGSAPQATAAQAAKHPAAAPLMFTAAAAVTPHAAAPSAADDGAADTVQAARGGGGSDGAAPAPALLPAAAATAAAADAVERALAIAKLKERSAELGACFDALQATMPAYLRALDEFNSMSATKDYEEARKQLEAASELVVKAKSTCDGHFF